MGSGDVTLLKLYVIVVFIEEGVKYDRTIYNSRIPKQDRAYLIDHYGLEKKNGSRYYTADSNDLFNQLVKDYPAWFKKNHINDYSTLYGKILIS